MQSFHISAFPFSLSPAGTDAVPNPSRFSWTTLLQDLVGKISMGKWVRAQILYRKDATSRGQVMGNWKKFHFMPDMFL